MKGLKFICIILVFCSVLGSAQDPHFSQYFMSPATINPALVGTGYGKYRLMSNYRDQWSIGKTPYRTYTMGLDANVFADKKRNKNILGLGLLFLGDQSNYGLLKSSYVSSSVSYHLNLNENNTVGVGFQSTLGKRYLDRVNLTFGNQFGSTGFDVNRASGENQLLKMPVFYSLNAGVHYSYQTTYNQFNMGLSLFNLNKPQQSFLKDISQRSSLETVFYSSYEFSSWNNLLFSANGIFRIQAKQNYFAIGGVVGLDMSKGKNIQVLYAGSWFREGDAIYPYVGIMLNNLQVGLSYDIVISKQNLGNINPQSIELSFIWRDLTNQSGKIICPWR